MLRLSNTLKCAALASVVGMTAIVAGASAASARTYTRCDADGDRCWRVHCDWDGGNCYRESSYHNSYYRSYDHRYDRGYYGGYNNGDRRWVCDADGDRCHWIYD